MFTAKTLAVFSVIDEFEQDGMDFTESKFWHGFSEDQNQVINDFLDEKDLFYKKINKQFSKVFTAKGFKKLDRIELLRNSINYQNTLKSHLARYKKTNLGIIEDGLWRGKPYPHILPKDLYRLNILETIREEFWDYCESENFGLNQKRHLNFHHLNSSQAMCFNLLFPFVMENCRYLPVLLDTLKFPKKNVLEVSFEKIIDEREGTNFDFYIKYKNGKQILFEVKLSENSFGSAKNDESHIKKYNEIYKNPLKKVVTKKFQEPPLFFKNYQLIRHFYYLGQY